MLERQGHLPGYTGHIPKNPALEEVGQAPVKYSHIPNYQGFIPGVKAENLFGKTYAKITEISSLGTHTNQLRIAVMPFRPKEYPEPPVDPIDLVPQDTVSKFFGMRVPGKGSGYRANEDIDVGNEEFRAEIREGEVIASYEEARKIASSS